MVLFYEPGLFVTLLLPAFFGMAYSGRTRPERKVWMVALASAYVPIGLYLLFVERAAPEVAVRGGPTLNLKFIVLNRVPDAAHQLMGLLTYWGVSGPLPEALALGWHEWRSHLGGWGVMIGFLVGLLFAVTMFPIKRDTIPDSQRLAKLVLIAIAWILLSITPVVLLRSQGFAIRMPTYTPSAGFALGVAAIAGLVVNFFKRTELSIRLALVATGIAVFVCGLSMAGLLRTYQLRSGA